MKTKAWLLGGAAAAIIGIGAALAQTAFPLVSSVVGTEIIQIDSSNTYSFLTTAQIKAYINAAASNIFSGALVQFGATAGAPTHLASGQTTAPALTSCGTSPSILGSDTSGVVTMGTASPTGCVITFTTAYKAAPTCVVNWNATPLASQSWSVSTTALTLTQTATSSNAASYICVANGGG
jgi:hypothetical protein